MSSTEDFRAAPWFSMPSHLVVGCPSEPEEVLTTEAYSRDVPPLSAAKTMEARRKRRAMAAV